MEFYQIIYYLAFIIFMVIISKYERNFKQIELEDF